MNPFAKIAEEIKRGRKKALKAIEAKAKENCPVVTGRLQREITIDGDSVVSPTPYAGDVERGNNSKGPQPYMHDAIPAGLAALKDELG